MSVSARVPSELPELPELPVRPRTVDPSRPTRSYYSRGQQPSTTTPHYASLQSKERLQRRPQTTEGSLGQQPWLVQPQLQPQHLAPPGSAVADRSAGSGRWSTSGADGASWHSEMSNGALFSIAASLSASASFTAAWTANDTIASELGTPQISVPRNVPLRDVFSVIEARERAVAALRGFLASFGYIRGNARPMGMPLDGLRRARAKLAWLLARVRAHTTVAVELIEIWERLQPPSPPLQPPPPPAAQPRQPPPPQKAAPPMALDYNQPSATSLTELIDGDGDGFITRDELHSFTSELHSFSATATASASAIGPEAALAAAAAPAATGADASAAEALSASSVAQPRFYWLGWNYLLKMATDLSFLPLPVEEDPLLLLWWRYNAPHVARPAALRMPPFTLTRPDLFQPPGLEPQFTFTLPAEPQFTFTLPAEPQSASPPKAERAARSHSATLAATAAAQGALAPSPPQPHSRPKHARSPRAACVASSFGAASFTLSRDANDAAVTVRPGAALAVVTSDFRATTPPRRPHTSSATSPGRRRQQHLFQSTPPQPQHPMPYSGTFSPNTLPAKHSPPLAPSNDAAQMDAAQTAQAEAHRAEVRRLYAEAALAVEGEWWLDAERLHLPSDLARMRAAAARLLSERRALGVSARFQRRLELTISERPPHDLAREMELIAYGFPSGYATKLERRRRENGAATVLQCCRRRRAVEGRVAKRLQLRREVSAQTIQKWWRSRQLRRPLAAMANVVSDTTRDTTLALRGKAVRASPKPEAIQMADSLGKGHARRRVLKRRWAALRSCVSEVKLRMLAATRLQCLTRTRAAVRLLRSRLAEQRGQALHKQVPKALADAAANHLQRMVHDHLAMNQLLHSQFTERLAWYSDSRLAALLRPLAAAVAARRLSVRMRSRALRHALGESLAANGMSTEALEERRLTARGRLTMAEATLGTLDSLHRAVSTSSQALNQIFSRNKDHKRKHALVSTKLERSHPKEVALHRRIGELRIRRHEVRGALDALRSLAGDSSLHPSAAAVLFAGQREALARKQALVDAKLSAALKELHALNEDVEHDRHRLAAVTTSMEIVLDVVAIQSRLSTGGDAEYWGRVRDAVSQAYVSSRPGSPTASASPRPATPTASASLPTSPTPHSPTPPTPHSPSQSLETSLHKGAGAGASADSADSAWRIIEREVLCMLEARKLAATLEIDKVRAEVAASAAACEVRWEIEWGWSEARGGVRALQALRSALLRFKHTRLERRKQEALGNCIITAQAAVSARAGKRTLAEIAGARELLGEVQRAHAGRPRPLLVLAIQLPASALPARLRARTHAGKDVEATELHASFEATATRLVDDVLLWMGWPDEALTYQSHTIDAAGGAKSPRTLTVSAVIAPCESLAGSLGVATPQRMGEVVLDEARSARLNPGLSGTASTLDLSGLSIATASIELPSREAMCVFDPPLYALEGTTLAEMAANQQAIAEATAQIAAAKEKDETIRLQVNRHPSLQLVRKESSQRVAAPSTFQVKGDGTGEEKDEAADIHSLVYHLVAASLANAVASIAEPGAEAAEMAAVDASISAAISAGSAKAAFVAADLASQLTRVKVDLRLVQTTEERQEMHDKMVQLEAALATATAAAEKEAEEAEKAEAEAEAEARVPEDAQRQVGGGVLAGGAVSGGAVSNTVAIVETNRHACNALAALSAVAAGPGLGSLSQAAAAQLSGRSDSAVGGGRTGRMRLKMNVSAMTSPQARLALARTRADMLKGKLKAISALQRAPGWGTVTCVGDPQPADGLWNMGVVEGGADVGRFCAYCAGRVPPVLARHAFIDCTRRMLGGMPQYAPQAHASLAGELLRREVRTAELLSKFERQVIEHGARKEVAENVRVALRTLRGVFAAHPVVLGSAHLSARHVAWPATAPPHSKRAACAAMPTGTIGRLRLLSRPLADEYSYASASLSSGSSTGATAAASARNGVWEEFKALLELSPRRSLLLGGAAAMATERVERLERRRQAAVAVEAGVEASEAAAPAAAAEDDEGEEDAAAAKLAAEIAAAGAQGAWLGEAAEGNLFGQFESLFPELDDDDDEGMDDALGPLPAPMPTSGPSLAPVSLAPVSMLSYPNHPTSSQPTSRLAPSPSPPPLPPPSPPLWLPSLTQPLTPSDVIVAAQSVGVGPTDFYLLPLVVEMLSAPLPGEWQEVLVNGQCRFRDGQGPLQAEHPLHVTYRSIVQRERRVRRARMRFPAWLHGPAERIFQFSDKEGLPYAFDFGLGRVVASGTGASGGVGALILMAMAGELSMTTDAIARAAVPQAFPAKGSERHGERHQSHEEAAAAAVLAIKISERADLAEQNRIEVMNKGSFSKLLGKRLLEDQSEQIRAEAATEEERLRELLHTSLHGTYDGVLGLPLVHTPRALSVTLDTALELGIDLVREPHLVWLADLARALPVPLGWAPIAAPIGSVVHELWYNEVTHSSQWLHPIDETVKDLLRSLRAPMRPSSAPVVETALGASHFVRSPLSLQPARTTLSPRRTTSPSPALV